MAVVFLRQYAAMAAVWYCGCRRGCCFAIAYSEAGSFHEFALFLLGVRYGRRWVAAPALISSWGVCIKRQLGCAGWPQVGGSTKRRDFRSVYSNWVTQRQVGQCDGELSTAVVNSTWRSMFGCLFHQVVWPPWLAYHSLLDSRSTAAFLRRLAQTRKAYAQVRLWGKPSHRCQAPLSSIAAIAFTASSSAPCLTRQQSLNVICPLHYPSHADSERRRYTSMV